MAQHLKIIRVFIGSPGGLDDERRAVRDVASEVNLHNSENWGCQFAILGWEDTIPGCIRPQDKINEDLDKCDYFIGVLWNRWGSSATKGASPYTSGFHEEYCRALSHISAGRMKDLALYFKSIEAQPGFVPDEQARKVIEFRGSLVDSKEVFFRDYSQLADFKDLVRAKLMEIGWREYNLINSRNGVVENTKQLPGVSLNEKMKIDEDDRLFNVKSQAFLSELNEQKQDSTLTAVDVARFRLIASAIHRPGNDEVFLSVHDANLVFGEIDSESLSEQEIDALVDSGVYHYHSKTVPLWRWLAVKHRTEPEFDRVVLLSVFGSEKLRRQALNLLRDADVSLNGKTLTPDAIIHFWLKEQKDEGVFDAVCSYLSSCIDEASLKIVEEVANELDAARRAKIDQALVMAYAKRSVDEALRRIVASRVDKVDETCLKTIFSNANRIPTTLLVATLDAQSELARLYALRLLADRREVPKDQLPVLLTDSNHEIRLIAVEEFWKDGKPLSDDVVKRTLAIQRNSMGLFAFGAIPDVDSKKYYEQYQVNRLSEMTYDALLSRMMNQGVFCEAELRVLTQRYLKKFVPALRLYLEDGFKSFFEAALKQSSAQIPSDSQLHAKLRSLEESMRTDYTSIALDAICRLNDRQDIDLVRKVLRSNRVDASASIISFLGRRGEWSDIDLILELEQRSRNSFSLLSFASVSFVEERAAAILELSRNRLADLFSRNIDFAVKSSVVRQLPRATFASLDEAIYLREMSTPAESYRVAVAKRCVECLSRKAISELLIKYSSQDVGAYYNVIHVLDLGISMPTAISKRVSYRI